MGSKKRRETKKEERHRGGFPNGEEKNQNEQSKKSGVEKKKRYIKALQEVPLSPLQKNLFLSSLIEKKEERRSTRMLPDLPRSPRSGNQISTSGKRARSGSIRDSKSRKNIFFCMFFVSFFFLRYKFVLETTNKKVDLEIQKSPPLSLNSAPYTNGH